MAIFKMEIQTPMAQGRSTKIISMIKWLRTGRSLMKNSLSLSVYREGELGSVDGALGVDRPENNPLHQDRHLVRR